jgi:PAS domain S-box-containing protein
MLARSFTELSPAAKGQLEIVNRNGQRLLRLVNTLLDFSRIEAGRVRAVYQPTDLAAFTTDLASVFRAAMERAGLRLMVDCPKLSGQVYVDRDMWEKIVLNLLSNAFKFTFDGEIAVTLRQKGQTAQLLVRDTGTGIPAAEMPRLFERFHRVQNAHGRTHEGSGIGLALVQELVKLHGGSIAAQSKVGQGTTFTVTVPLGADHLPSEQVGKDRSLASSGAGASAYVEEALRWLPEELQDTPDPEPELPKYSEPLPTPYAESNPGASAERPIVLIADDNADMRQYVARLLAERYRVEAVPDGEAVLVAVQNQLPDLILADVMMPRLDGFGLLRRLRDHPETRSIPVILLSARAGEESRVEGMETGADDYLVKPFGARELLARVSAHLQMARLRREANEALLAQEAELREAQRLAHVGSWHWDAKTDVTTGSAEFFRIYGLDPATQAFPSFKDQDGVLYPHASWQRIDQAVKQTLQSGAGYELDVEAFQGGKPIWVTTRSEVVRNAQGEIVGLRGTVQDITERKQAEEAVRASEQTLFSLVERCPFGIYIVDADFRIASMNAGSQTGAFINVRPVLGRPLEEAMRILWPEPIAAEIISNFRHTLDTGEPYYSKDFLNPRADIDLTEGYEWELHRITLPNGRKGVVCYYYDSTRLRQVERALRESDQKKSEFLSILAHELRNPLAPIRNGLQLMKLAKYDASAIEQARIMMERQLQQMVRLIDDLMDLTRISSGKITLKKARIPLAAAVQNAVETSGPLLEAAGHDLILDVPDEPIYVDADDTRLAQVFANLLNNAAKYTERGEVDPIV